MGYVCIIFVLYLIVVATWHTVWWIIRMQKEHKLEKHGRGTMWILEDVVSGKLTPEQATDEMMGRRKE